MMKNLAYINQNFRISSFFKKYTNYQSLIAGKNFASVQKALLLCLLLASSTFSFAQDQLLGLTSTGGPQFAGTAFSIKSNGTGFTVQRAFAKSGLEPWGDLAKGPDGNYYGMTVEGGNKDYGTIFRMTPNGTITIIKHLDYYNGGGHGYGNLILGSDGNFYGMTYSGGNNEAGTIFRISTAGAFTVLRHLKASTDGGFSFGSLVKGADGNFYGMTHKGGTYDDGTIFKITPAGAFTVLRHLKLENDGGLAYGNLVQGNDGYFYGMTHEGGATDYGTIFKISSSGAFTKLRNLTRSTDGGSPYGSLIKGTDGNFYGMTNNGGANDYGTIFRITAGGTFTVRRHLDYATGGSPMGSLVQGTDGSLYGMTYETGTYGSGVIFKLTSSGVYTVLRHLKATTDGQYPVGSLVQGFDGHFYGMSRRGGLGGYGAIFKISTGGTFSVLANFPESSKGTLPNASLVQGKDGNYYGTTSEGGTYNYGTVFKLCNGTFSVIRSFNGNTIGGTPNGNLVQGTDGNFYGMTYQGGTYGKGTIFKITTGGTITILRHLNGTVDGANPNGGLVQGTDGLFYGMTEFGGTNNYGTIFRISSTGAFTVLRQLNYDKDGAYPKGNLMQGKDGNFYGMTGFGGTNNYGTIFKIAPAGTFTVLYHFNLTNGANPQGSLVQAADGNFYGMSKSGGTGNSGTIFKITSGGTFTLLRRLIYDTDGANPEGSLVQGTDGSFYGMTTNGGTNDDGTIFKVTSTGALTVLRHLNEATDGANPMGNLVVQKANPVAIAQSVITSEDTPKAITLSGTGGTPLTYTIVTQPKNGTLSGAGANRTYKPKANFTGSDSFTFTVTWGCQTSAAKTVTITVSATNDAPILAAIGNKTVAKGTLLSFTATATDPDAGQTKTFSLVGAPAGANINATSGAFSWTPATSGTYTFTVKVTDNGSPALSDQEQITVNVTTGTTAARIASSAYPETEQTFTAKVYPNPAVDQVTVDFSATSEIVSSVVTDANGVEVLKDKHQVIEAGRIGINLNPLKTGIYLLQIHTNQGLETFKIIKK